jgi:thymidylate synthase
LTRDPFPLPTIRLKRKPEHIVDYTYDDIELTGYQCHARIPAPIAV